MSSIERWIGRAHRSQKTLNLCRFPRPDAQNLVHSPVKRVLENFADAGALVAILTDRMRVLALLLLAALPAGAQQWSASIGSGPFVFGHFAERRVTIGNEGAVTTTRSRLSAATRAGAAADLERDFGRWLGVRLAATWTQAPLSIKSGSGSSTVSLDRGKVGVTSFSLPVVVHLTRGAVQFQVFGGPAYALYDVFNRTRGRWGGTAGVGVAWGLTPRFAVEWQASDMVTASPLHVQEVAANGKGVTLMRPNNGHTTVGVRYRF